MEPPQSWANWGSVLASFMFIAAFAKDFLPFSPRSLIKRISHKLFDFLYPYAEIRIDEQSRDWLRSSSKVFDLVSVYLAANSSKSARKLRANLDKDSENLNLSMDVYQEITDEYSGVTVWWSSHTSSSRPSPFTFYSETEERRYYILAYNKRHRELIINSYLKHVFNAAKAIEVKNRRRKLFTNMPTRDHDSFSSRKRAWSSVGFEHPASFDTLAMDHDKKAEILEDLDFFKNGKDYYAKIGKTWKRGYLLYGPPGTGKSTLIAAIAKHMDYDVYDLELTAVKSNTELRKLLIDTSSKSIIVIEDIDCSLDLTAERKNKKMEEKAPDGGEKQKIPRMDYSERDESKVTLSGLLNFIDGLWSSCGEERLIIFTTNHIEKLDPALIRTGRMDKHIEMSYCTYEGFTVLAKNFLNLEDQPLFDEVKKLLENEKVEVTPADVAERLMPRTRHEKDSRTPCLEKVIEFMKNAKEEKMKKEKDGDPQESTVDDDGLTASSEGSD
ncbi:AAA-ATPase [Nymphaea thermarum]|nr:AAA-ATPase [Nymphaea thermarum]